MTDRGREEQWRSGSGEEPTQQFGYGHPGYTDPAYASQTPYGPPYQAPPPPRPTERLPAYSPYGYDPSATGPTARRTRREPGASRRRKTRSRPAGCGSWPGVAVVTVIGLVIALVIVNSSRQETVVAPLPSVPEPSFSTPAPTTTSRTPSTTSRTPSTPVLPVPTLPSRTPPTDTTVDGATDTVVYTVDGTGRAINITYVDNGGLLQTEFNVMLPWSKEVSLPQPAEGSASISIINVGRELTCSISVNGVAVEQRTGAGLTICATTG